MQRTQIYFPSDLHEDLMVGAKLMNVSLSEYIRIILAEKLYRIPVVMPVRKTANLSVLSRKAISFGKKDLAKNFNKYFEASLK